LGVAGVSSQRVFLASEIVVPAEHLLLDSLTERRVYIVTGSVALAHLSAGNGILNGLFLVGGLIFFLL
jgi:hypothetical protein